MEGNITKFQNGFIENLRNIVLQTLLSAQTQSMTITEGSVILDCCFSPNQKIFQGWNSKSIVGQIYFSRVD